MRVGRKLTPFAAANAFHNKLASCVYDIIVCAGISASKPIQGQAIEVFMTHFTIKFLDLRLLASFYCLLTQTVKARQLAFVTS